MNKDLNNTAVKPNNEIEEKAIIALYELAGFKRWNDGRAFTNKLIGHEYITLDSTDFEILKGSPVNKDKITLDQLAWGYGLNPDDATSLNMVNGRVCWANENYAKPIDGSEWGEGFHSINKEEVISTRPKQTLQNGDYLPVSEIKTEQNLNDVVKAAENCGFDVSVTKYPE